MPTVDDDDNGDKLAVLFVDDVTELLVGATTEDDSFDDTVELASADVETRELLELLTATIDDE